MVEYIKYVGNSLIDTPGPTQERLEAAKELGDMIVSLLSASLSRPSFRAAWTLIDKVLNKALDFDVRICHPESFSILAERLDHAVFGVVLKVLHVTDLSLAGIECIRLSTNRGGCGLTSARTKGLFAHTAVCCQVCPRTKQCFCPAHDIGVASLEAVSGMVE